MTQYLQRIWTHLVDRHRLRRHRDNRRVRVFLREEIETRWGGSKNYEAQITRYVLTHHREEDYLEFREEVLFRRVYQGKVREETIEQVWVHVTVNADGSVKRVYSHRDGEITAVRTLSLRNFYKVRDDELARLLMANRKELAWIREIPVMFYPVSNSQLPGFGSVEGFIEYFTGPGAVIPSRFWKVLPREEVFVLVQIVPASHFNVISATLRRDARFIRYHPWAPRVMAAYYRHALDDGDKLNVHLVRGYVACIRGLGLKCNMRIRSSKRFRREWEELRRRRDVEMAPKFHPRKVFPSARTQVGGIEFEWIDSKARLLEEAERMQSCVADYARSVGEGFCALYHVIYRKRPYTLEVRWDEDGTPFARQLAGVRNAAPPVRLTKRIDALLEEQP